MWNYNEMQMSETNRRFNDITACKIVRIDDEFGLEFALPWGETAKIKPKDFGVAKYQPGEFIDMRLWTVNSQNHISLKAAQFVNRTPERFAPKD